MTHERQVRRVVNVATALLQSPLPSLFVPPRPALDDPSALLSSALDRILTGNAAAEPSAQRPRRPAGARGAGASRSSHERSVPVARGAAPSGSERGRSRDEGGERDRFAVWASRLESAAVAPGPATPTLRETGALAIGWSGARLGPAPDSSGGEPRAVTQSTAASGVAQPRESLRLVETPAALATLLQAQISPAALAHPTAPSLVPSLRNAGAAVTAAPFQRSSTAARSPTRSAPLPNVGSAEQALDWAAPSRAPVAADPLSRGLQVFTTATAGSSVTERAASALPAPSTPAASRAERRELATGDGRASPAVEADDAGPIRIAPLANGSALSASVANDRPLSERALSGGQPLGAVADGTTEAIAEELLVERLLDILSDRLREQQIRQFGITGGEL